MNRRNLFKMLGAAAVSVVCAPLVKLLPLPEPERPKLTINPRNPILDPNPNGIAVRFVSRYDGTPPISRIDVLHGWHNMYPESACRIRAVAKQADKDLEAVTGIYGPA